MDDGHSISVLLPVHRSANPEGLQQAYDSITDQTVVPDEVVIVTNDPLPASLKETLSNIDERSDVDANHIIDYEPDTLGGALQVGLQNCRGTYVARMDADDVAEPHRLKQQIEWFQDYDVDVVGSHLVEFTDDSDDPQFVRRVPITHDEIEETVGWRCPVNHPTVMFRRKSILAAGGYRPIDSFEDWDLWSRCIANGFQFANIPEALVRARAGKDLYARRGGLDYAIDELVMQRRLYRLGFLSKTKFLRNVALRIPPRILPTSIRGHVYERFARSTYD